MAESSLNGFICTLHSTYKNVKLLALYILFSLLKTIYAGLEVQNIVDLEDM
jgi:hypothetical protein